MSDDFRIDSHKLIFHPVRVSQWLQGDDIYPIYVEIAPSGSCNHRCVFCALDYLEYKPVFLDKDLILTNLREMAAKGVRSVMYAGEGEPLINKDTPEIVNKTREIGVDVAMTSNGVLFSKEKAAECLSSFTWVRFSVNAGTPETYQRVHRCRPGDFEKVISNLNSAVEIKRRKGLSTTIGAQMLLIPLNFQEVLTLGRMLREIGVDYFTIKPYSQHPKSNGSINSSFDYQEHLHLESQLRELETDTFQVIFRSNTMKKLSRAKPYNRCLGLPFWAYIDARANVWACSTYLGDADFCYGSLKEMSFSGIWEGAQRSKVLARIAKTDISKCREVCRLDEINIYLNNLRNPSRHVNFI